MKKVLVVDDEQSIVKLLEFNLNKEGFAVETAMDGVTAYEMAKTGAYDMIILDLMLPEMDGMEVCRRLRMEPVETPILMLTAKDAEIEKILGLELGADDYMTKPFSPREVVARIRAILRRAKATHGSESKAVSDDSLVVSPIHKRKRYIEAGPIAIDTETFTVKVNGKSIEMTPKEYELLKYMVGHKNRTVARDRLLQQIWSFDYRGGTRIVDVHISHLREKIEEDPKNPDYIKTVRGFGYRFEVPE